MALASPRYRSGFCTVVPRASSIDPPLALQTKVYVTHSCDFVYRLLN
jgi:hypothetical protein